MELPSTVDGAPHACFDSTGLVFGITAPMAAGSGHVRSKHSIEAFMDSRILHVALHTVLDFELTL
jgi:hypothetical protein